MMIFLNNNNGQVLTWQLTKGTSIAYTEAVLANFHGQSQLKIKIIYVDNCCKL